MALKPIEWENLSAGEQLALAAAGEHSPLAFTALWFNITQGDSFRTNWHHRYFNWAAERLFNCESQNIIINIPPGGTKTEFWSVHCPVYAMIKFPRVRILNTSYSKDLVNENSERSRSLVKSSEFQQFYPYDIGKDKVDDWTLEQDGKRKHQLFSRSSGGQITGVRGGYMGKGYSGHVQADDWDKMDDLFSEAKRNKSHTRIVNTLRSRRANSSTPFLAVQQRGHVEDSTAFLLSGGAGLKIDLHIKIPALIDHEYIDSLPDGIRERCIKDVCGSKQVDGKWSYWPEKDSIDDLLALREAHPYTFTSQYMQAPEELSGGVFNADAFGFYSDDPEHGVTEKPPYFEYRFITADTAQKTGERNDYSVFAHWGVYQGKLYLVDLLRGKWEAPALRSHALALIQSSWAMNGPVDGNLRSVLIEDKSSGTGLIQDISAASPCPITPIQRNRDKYTRSLDCQGSQHAGKILLPYGAPYNVEFIAEVASFAADDSHKHDDQTDVMMDAIDHAILQEQGPGSAMIFKRRR